LKKIAVLGAGGKIGKSIRKNLEKKYDVTGFDIKTENDCIFLDLRKNFKPPFKFNTVINATGTFSFSLPYQVLYEDNVITAVNAFKFYLLSEADQFIHISTTAVYGASKKPLIEEESFLSPENKYEKTKKIAEDKIIELSKRYRKSFIIIRLSLVRDAEKIYGLHKILSLFSFFGNTIGFMPFIRFDFKKTHTVSMDFLIKVINILIEKEIKNGIFNVADKIERIDDFFQENAKKFNLKLIKVFPEKLKFLLPPFILAIGIHPLWLSYLNERIYKTEKIQKLLN